ncbi:Succinylglutamic semialdehyde dehydrogenase [hydrothermal vent metagenome]|uniref:Succinylglutamic semialdehyde dehydrogenase n=1 Tax=hydrothermal vent metagenome TaxID=652676 RepID=A0A3B0RYV5_9ZZZZ
MQYQDCLIDNQWQQGEGEAFTSTNPANGQPVWQGNAASPAQVDAAFISARKAAPGWAQTPLAERLVIVRAFKQEIEQQKQVFAELICKESGKVLWETNAEVGAILGKVELSISSYEQRTGSNHSKTPFGTASLRHRPHGVMAVLGPYNFPGHLPNGHIVPALIAGDTVVFKPSELTPAVGAFMADAWRAAGLPDGVFNLVQGGRNTGGAVLDHRQLDGVLFTGSATTGAFIHKKFGGRPEIMLALEMGGNNPLVIWDAKDVEAAANLAVQSAFITSGQRCSCARRLIVKSGQEGDALIEAMVAQIDRLLIGPWDAQEAPFMGCLVSEQAASMVLQDQAAHMAAGAKPVREARRLDWSKAALSPSLLEMGQTKIADEETFGPMAQIYRAADFEQAITLANNTRFGLAAGLISDDAGLWEVFTGQIRAGIVNFNRPTTGAASSLPFGGPGISGNHRPGAWYAADYCAWPMASQEAAKPEWTDLPGLSR